jgi:hypothetical protein
VVETCACFCSGKEGPTKDGGDADYAVIESWPVSWPSDPD